MKNKTNDLTKFTNISLQWNGAVTASIHSVSSVISQSINDII